VLNGIKSMVTNGLILCLVESNDKTGQYSAFVLDKSIIL
jgi:hypothetical protein